MEHGTFTPLVFSMTGVEGPEASKFQNHIAQKISVKTEENYARMLSQDVNFWFWDLFWMTFL